MATGYTRQSAAQIAAGNIVTDTGLEAEFDAIVAAMSASGGHNHDGTTGGGALISLTSSVTGILPVANGGTAASTASGARTSLGLAIGSNVQAWSTHLDAIAALSKTDGNIIVADGTTFVAESGATARASLGAAGLTDNNSLTGTQSYSRAGSILTVANSGSSSYGATFTPTGTNSRAMLATLASGSGAEALRVAISGATAVRAVKVDYTSGSLDSTIGTAGAFNITSTQAGAAFLGTDVPVFEYAWTSGSPAANDTIILDQIVYQNTSLANNIYARQTYVVDNASPTMAGTWNFQTMVGGTLDTDAFSIGEGVSIGAPTGGKKGEGTLNAKAVYDDNVLLTDYVFDKYFKRTNVEYQDERIQDLSDMFNESALDIDYYSEYWRVNNHLPGMPSQEHYFLDRPSTGQMIQKLWETVEVQAVHIHELNKRLKNIEASKFCECK